MSARNVLGRLPLVRRTAPVVDMPAPRPKIVPRGVLKIKQARAAGAYLLPMYLLTLLSIMVAVELAWPVTSEPRRLGDHVTADARLVSEFASGIGGYGIRSQ
ncbi:MAG: hypothetical protein GEU87_02430 [Alphaproteobacteria bacterium]|nr:hypothetical protein [Alphaproteobacteria bacterium]